MTELRTRDEIREDVRKLRTRRSYRTTIITMRIMLMAFPAFGIGWWLQYSVVPKPIVASILVASFIVGLCSGLVYFFTAMFLAIEQSVKARSLYNPTANIEFFKVYFTDLFRPIIRRRYRDDQSDHS